MVADGNTAAAGQVERLALPSNTPCSIVKLFSTGASGALIRPSGAPTSIPLAFLVEPTPNDVLASVSSFSISLLAKQTESTAPAKRGYLKGLAP